MLAADVSYDADSHSAGMSINETPARASPATTITSELTIASFDLSSGQTDLMCLLVDTSSRKIGRKSTPTQLFSSGSFNPFGQPKLYNILYELC